MNVRVDEFVKSVPDVDREDIAYLFNKELNSEAQDIINYDATLIKTNKKDPDDKTI